MQILYRIKYNYYKTFFFHIKIIFNLMCNKMSDNTYSNTTYLFLTTETYVLIITNNLIKYPY